MKTQVSELEPNKVALFVEVGEEKVAEAFKSFYSRASQIINVPGFRKGKVPRSILKNYLNDDFIRSQVEEELLEELVPQAIKEAKLHPISRCSIEESHLQEGQPFTFKAVFEVRPKLNDIAYTGHHVQVKRAIIGENSINKVLKDLQEQFAKSAPLENGELQVGDYFLANISAFIDGQPEPELSEEKGYHKLLDIKTMFTPMKGMKIGETRTYQYTFDNDSEKNSKFYGKTVQFQVKLERISRPIIPELNDDFAKEVGDFQTLEDLKNKIRSDLEAHELADAKDRAVDAILNKIISSLDVKIPESMINKEIDRLVASVDSAWRRMGSSLDEYLKKSNQKLSEFREVFREKAIQEVKISLVVTTIVEREKMEVSDAEYREEIERRAKITGLSVDNILDIVQSDNLEEEIRDSVLSRKVKEFLLKNNEVHYDMVEEGELNKGESSGDAGSNSN